MRAALTALACVLGASTAAANAPSAAPPPPLTAYGNVPDIEMTAVSPSGGGLAVIARMQGERMLLLLDAEHRIRARAALGDIKVRALDWVGEDHVLLVKSSTQELGSEFTEAKHEFLSATLVPTDGSKAMPIFEGKASMAQAIFGRYGSRLIDGEWQTLVAGIEFRRSTSTGSHLAAYEFGTGNPALFAVGLTGEANRRSPPAPEGHLRDWLVDAAGRAAATLDIETESGRWAITGTNGVVLASGADPAGHVDLVSLGRGGDSVIYAARDADGETSWYEVALDGGRPIAFLPKLKLERLFVDGTNGHLLGYLEDAANAQPVLYDPAQQSLLRKVYRAFPKVNVEVRSWTPTFSHVVVRTSGNGDSGTWYLVELEHLKAFPIGVERPAIPAERVGPLSVVPYVAADGLPLDGVLTLPSDREPVNLPLVMMPHGGPHAHDQAEFDWWAQAFASRGYAVFQPNFRGSTNRDDAFVRAGYGQWGRKMQSDVSDGLAALGARGIVDPRRACIVGASYGGYAALAGVTLQQGLYRCVVAVAPVTDLADMYWTDYRESGNSEMVKRSLRESLGDPSSFAAVSPRRNASRADAPILLIHGEDDTVVPLKQSAAMAEALKAAGKPYEFVTMPGEDHWLSRTTTRNQMLETAMQFVARHNPAD